MQVVKIAPRGYCYGVVDAMTLTLEAIRNKNLPRPIYILGMIVHNRHVTEAFKEEGVVTLDGPNRLEILEKIVKGTVIFTAHGVSPSVRQRAKEKGLTVIDATCPDVTKTHELIRTKVSLGYEVVYIGKRNHPEPEGAMGIEPGRVHLIEKEEDIEQLQLEGRKLIITNQTTMSQWDIKHLMAILQTKYPQAEIHNEVCMATQIRQEAVAKHAGEAQLCLVVGDPRSNNSNRLAQVSQEIAKVPAYRIADVTEIKQEWLLDIERVSVTSGASTPTALTKEVIQYVEQFDKNKPGTWLVKRTVNPSKLLPKMKAKTT